MEKIVIQIAEEPGGKRAFAEGETIGELIDNIEKVFPEGFSLWEIAIQAKGDARFTNIDGNLTLADNTGEIVFRKKA